MKRIEKIAHAIHFATVSGLLDVSSVVVVKKSFHLLTIATLECAGFRKATLAYMKRRKRNHIQAINYNSHGGV